MRPGLSWLGSGGALSAKVQPLQGAYIDERQIGAVTKVWQSQGEPDLHEVLLEEVEAEKAADAREQDRSCDDDPLLPDAVALVAQVGSASTSMLQRRVRLGYTRAARLIDMLERRGVISGYEGRKPRRVLISEAEAARVVAELETAGASGR